MSSSVLCFEILGFRVQCFRVLGVWVVVVGFEVCKINDFTAAESRLVIQAVVFEFREKVW